MRVLTVLIVSAIGSVGLKAQGTVLSGVVSGVDGGRIAGASVSLPALAHFTATSDSGTFRFTDIPAGAHEMRIRKVGFKESVETVHVPDAGITGYKVVLHVVQLLAPVEVTADPYMADFEDNRRIGLGKFMTRAELEPLEHRKLGDIIENVGAKVSRGGPHSWLPGARASNRSGGASKCPILEGRPVPERYRNTPRNPGCGVCWAQIYLNGAKLYGGEESGLVPDLNFILPQTIEAIEYYKGPAQTPLKYSTLNSQCGVLVIHTRRSPGSATKQSK